MSREQRIREILSQHFDPLLLGIENESHQHAGPATESHFKVLIVSDRFQGLSRVERQRAIQDLLKFEFQQGLHALTQRALTPEEHQKGLSQGFVSPNCITKKIK